MDCYHAYHFLEHLTGEDGIQLLKEVQRTLKIGGIFQYGIPLSGTVLSFQDLTHKSFWNEKTFETLFENAHGQNPEGGIYTGWKLNPIAQLIVGVVSRHLMLVGQLIRVP